jgi:hypothetical protein
MTSLLAIGADGAHGGWLAATCFGPLAHGPLVATDEAVAVPNSETPPSRRLLAAATYADARSIVEELKAANPAEKGLSAQALGIAPKSKRRTTGFLKHPGAQACLLECHPALRFRDIAEGAMTVREALSNEVDLVE